MVHFSEEHIFKIADRCYRKGVGGRPKGKLFLLARSKNTFKKGAIVVHFTEEHSLKGHKCG